MVGSDRLVAGGTGDGLVERRAAGVVDQERGRPVDGVPPVAPVHQGHQRRGEVGSLGGQVVLVTNRSILVGHPVHDLQVDQALEPVGQEVSGDSEVLVEAFEAAYSAEEVPEDEQGPTVADRRQGGCDGTAVGGGVVGHGRSVAVSCEMKRTSSRGPEQAVRTSWSEG